MIKINNLTKQYDNSTPVQNFSYDFENGKKHIVFGPSGSGKTTLLRLIAGFEDIDAGEILKDGVCIGNSEFQLHASEREMGVVFQNPNLWPHLTVKNNIGFGLYKCKNSEKQSRINAIMEDLEITNLANKYLSQISGGEAKRVALARMMVVKWQYLLLDEPLANLDTMLKFRIIDKINNYVTENNATLIYVTHDNKEAEAIGDETIDIR